MSVLGVVEEPPHPLKSLLQMPSSLFPVMVTDAKALYDSYHREGVSSSVVDERVSLEIRVMKERLQQLQGILKWMSSERQFADGLTKESARLLLSQRLRHGRLKLVLDPEYVAAKKKTKQELDESKMESTGPPVKKKHTRKFKNVLELEEIPENADVNPPENVMFVSTNDLVTYDTAASHVVRRREYNVTCRMQNVYLWLLVLSFAISAVVADAEHEICPLDSPEKFESEEGNFGSWLSAILATLGAMIFVLGTWSVTLTPRKNVKDVEIQKNEPIVHSRLREAMEKEHAKMVQYRAVALEARQALDLSHGDLRELYDSVLDGIKNFEKGIV